MQARSELNQIQSREFKSVCRRATLNCFDISLQFYSNDVSLKRVFQIIFFCNINLWG